MGGGLFSKASSKPHSKMSKKRSAKKNQGGEGVENTNSQTSLKRLDESSEELINNASDENENEDQRDTRSVENTNQELLDFKTQQSKSMRNVMGSSSSKQPRYLLLSNADNSSIHASQKLSKKTESAVVNIEDIEKYCRPQHLCLYNPQDSGFKYNLIGLFGLPMMPEDQQVMYTVLVSVLPPAEPYKEKPFNSMFASHLFSDVDFEKSKNGCQLFDTDNPAIEMSGIVLKLLEHSSLLFDIKQFDLKTGEMQDFGFALQPLIHTLKKQQYLISGRYQIPVYAGKVPQEILSVARKARVSEPEKPRHIFKRMIHEGQVKQIGKVQVVSQIEDLNPPEDEINVKFDALPSMLHHIDKSQLERFTLNRHLGVLRARNPTMRHRKTIKNVREGFMPGPKGDTIYKTMKEASDAAHDAFK